MRISIGYSGSTHLPLTLPAVDAAERAGLSGVWSAEHVGMNDAIVPSAVYATRTSRLEIGVMGLNADTRSPGVLAMELATLSSIAPGRVRAHIGTGSPQRATQIGVRSPRTLGGVEAFADALRRLLRGEQVTARSEAFELDAMTISTADDTLPPVPIDIMAIRPKMTALAARIGDGLSLSVGSSHDYLRSQVELVERVLQDQGRERGAFRVSAAVLASVDADLDSARMAMATALAGFPPGLPEMVAGLELPDPAAVAAAKAEGGPAHAATLFTFDTVEALGLVATPQTLAAAIERYRSDGVDELIVLPLAATEAHPGIIELLAPAVER
ncbi:MAG TPA: LLM class flavin-dependent oxidoreductase [Pseudolysinimonas sp.]|nr:LLM class flavin-dependent oxidoreductase [Pseudolysinimonas sp.]